MNQTVDTGYGPYDQVATVKDKRSTVITTGFYTSTAGCALNGKPQALTLSTLNGQSNVKLHDYCWNADGTLSTLTEYLEPGNTTRKRITAYSYEAGSNGLKVSDVNVTGSGQTLHTHLTYDNLGRKQTETFYRRTSPTDATLLALTTTYAYDALNRPVKVTETTETMSRQVNRDLYRKSTHIATTNVLGNTANFAYDEAGNPTCIINANALSVGTDPGHQPVNAQACTESRSYDELNRLIQSKYALNTI